jgi:hypothetical protein
MDTMKKASQTRTHEDDGKWRQHGLAHVPNQQTAHALSLPVAQKNYRRHENVESLLDGFGVS